MTRSKKRSLTEARNAAIRDIKRPRKISPPVVDNEDEDTESEAESCCEDHNDYTNFKIETDRRYFEKNAELYNTTCMKCKKCITVEKKERLFHCFTKPWSIRLWGKSELWL